MIAIHNTHWQLNRNWSSILVHLINIFLFSFSPIPAFSSILKCHINYAFVADDISTMQCSRRLSLRRIFQFRLYLTGPYVFPPRTNPSIAKPEILEHLISQLITCQHHCGFLVIQFVKVLPSDPKFILRFEKVAATIFDAHFHSSSIFSLSDDLTYRSPIVKVRLC